MDVDEILALERELTDEEFLFLEAETLERVRRLRRMIGEMLPSIRSQAPMLADRLELSVNTMVLALEAGAAIPIGDKRSETETLKDLALSVRRQEQQVTPVVRLPRRDRRHSLLGRRRRRKPRDEAPEQPSEA